MLRHLALALLLTGSSLLAQAPAKDTSIGVWPWLVGNIDSRTTSIINQCRATGLDTIYLHLWRTTGSSRGTLYMRDEAGTFAAPGAAVNGLVTLSSFIRAAHNAGLQVIGVVHAFKDKGPYPDDLSHQDFLLKKILRYLVHSYDAQGKPLYPLDGIALDYIRWFGGNHSPTYVNRFIDDMRQEVGPMPIHAFVIAGAYAVDGGSYDNNFRSYSNFTSYVSTNFGQNWEQLATRLDCLLPMAYTANGHVYGNNLTLMEGYLRQVGRLARTAVQNARATCRIAPAVRMWNDSSGTTTQQTLEASCRGALNGGADGFMGFRFFTASGKSSWWTGMQKYCQSGSDRPIARLSYQNGVLDSSASFHQKFASAQLRVRYDLDGDGSFETANLSPGRHQLQLPGFGARVVSVEVTDPDGHRAIARHRVELPTTLTPALHTVSASQGGKAVFLLDPGQSHAGDKYVVFCSLSGSNPGTPLGALQVPLVADNLTLVAYSAVNTPLFTNFAGKLNIFGRAAPTFDLPKGVVPFTWVGARVFMAAVVVDQTTGTPELASNPVQVQIGQ